ncbi:MAG: alpha-amylase family glycosyl hydrolase [Planctomycetota bacterium]
MAKRKRTVRSKADDATPSPAETPPAAASRAREVAPSDPLARRIQSDPLLQRYRPALERRMTATKALREVLRADGHGRLAEFADGHRRFGVVRDGAGQDADWLVREWAPNATAVYLKGPFSDWQAKPAFALTRMAASGVAGSGVAGSTHGSAGKTGLAAADDAGGIFELRLPAETLAHGTPYRLEVHWPDSRGITTKGDRMPAYAQRVVHHEDNWDAEIWQPARPYAFQHKPPTRKAGAPRFIYEAHIGMAQEAKRIGTFDEFRTEVLPRIRAAGYDTVQLMGLAEHSYYGSFGYQISSYFAPSSRFGTPDDLKRLIDEAHGMGLCVLMDLVHSHMARNIVEGISRQDGSESQYTLPGERGEHPAWGSRCFAYHKREVLRFLLSNCRYWLEEYRIDGFRFDGVTSMLYRDHGLNREFTSYDDYFAAGTGTDEDLAKSVDEHAYAYLALANELIHEVLPEAVTIAEDVSGMPGLALPVAEGGCGFDYRFAMGVADEWVRLVKDVQDEQWPMDKVWFELTNRRRDERTISYVESHDQAMVGDQTLIFRMAGERVYEHMSRTSDDVLVDRAMALHKLLRLLTVATAGDGYLNFMGNEFGHPDWIDFPRVENDWSHEYARRQWSLSDDDSLRYGLLRAFDRELLLLCRTHGIPDGTDHEYQLLSSEPAKVLAWLRGPLLFVVNLHPQQSLPAARIPAAPGHYRIVLDSDAPEFGGHDRIDRSLAHEADTDRIHRHHLQLYLPARTALVLERTAAAP